MANILICDDDPQIRDILIVALEGAGHVVRSVERGQKALSMAQQDAPDLMVLDIGLPDIDGLEVCQTLRRSSDLPILFLTARDDEIDRVLGLEMGADDYVTKPFSPRELNARIKAILKRVSGVSARGVFERGVLRIDPETHSCLISGVPLQLTATEMALMAHLIRKPDQITARPALTDAIYGTNIHVSDRTLDSHLRNLRAKLKAAGCGDAIETVHGVGVRMGQCMGAHA